MLLPPGAVSAAHWSPWLRIRSAEGIGLSAAGALSSGTLRADHSSFWLIGLKAGASGNYYAVSLFAFSIASYTKMSVVLLGATSYSLGLALLVITPSSKSSMSSVL